MTLTLLNGANGEKPGDSGLVVPRFALLQGQNSSLVARATGLPDASNRCTTTTNDTGQVIDLTDLGFVFLADHIYRLKIKAVSGTTTTSMRVFQEIDQMLLGGTTPVLLGEPRILYAGGTISAAAVSWGRVALHATTSGATVTVTAAETSPGISLGNFTSGAATMTFPVSRLARVLSAHFAEDAGTAADTRTIQVRTVAVAGTAVVNTSEIVTAGAVTSPTGVNNLDILMDLAPPIQVFFAMNSNNVEVQILGVTSQAWTHRVDVYIDDARFAPIT